MDVGVMDQSRGTLDTRDFPCQYPDKEKCRGFKGIS